MMPKKINIVIKFIIINLSIFVLVKIISLGGEEYANKFVEWFAVPTNLKKLLFKPWTPFTYMFLHEGLMHFLGNMLWLYFLGTIFIQFIDEKKLIAVYIIGGLSGAALYIFVYNLAPLFLLTKIDSVAIGASGAISAIVIAISVYKPNFTIRPFGFFDLKLKWLAVIFIAIDIISLWGENTGGHVAHLGGAAYGFIFGYKLTKNNDITEWFTSLFTNISKKKKPKMKVKYNNSIPRSDYEYNKDKADMQEEMDRILDKISQKGYKSLTNREKNFLFRFSDKK